MKFIETTANSWIDLVEVAEKTLGFIFRGQADSRWPLKTSLERAVDRYPSILHSGMTTPERWMLHEFKTKYSIYTSSQPPEHNDCLEWLSIMQHHGAPTRLLDFSSSLYVAIYFSLCTASSEASVWCINRWKIRDNFIDNHEPGCEPHTALKDEVNTRHKHQINKIIGNGEKFLHLIPLESDRASQRLARQQGIFLVPTSFWMDGMEFSFEDNLKASFGPNANSELNLVDISEVKEDHDNHRKYGCIKINIPKTIQDSCLQHLNYMGVNEEGLFPGLDGLARSLTQSHIRL